MGRSDEDLGGYAPLADYAFLSNRHDVALVSRRGSIDWCCMPRADADPSFAALLDRRRGGRCAITPTDPDARCHRRYERDSLVLVTTFETEAGAVEVVDAFTVTGSAPGEADREHVRRIVGLRGTLELAVAVAPTVHYGLRPATIEVLDDGLAVAETSDGPGLAIAHDLPLHPDESEPTTALGGLVQVTAGDRHHLQLLSIRDGADAVETAADHPPERIDERLDRTVGWWQGWARQLPEGIDDSVSCSAAVLKGLTLCTTGAIAAAATTSLPEVLGGSRNWDYRASWIRDSEFTARAFVDLGLIQEADEFRRFAESAAGDEAEHLQTVFGLGGERDLHERELDHLEGYACSRPVRVGNGAAGQAQHDRFGYLPALAAFAHERGEVPTEAHWRFLVDVIELAAERWDQPDRGIWEVRHDPRRFVHSMVMCWVALDRGITLARAEDLPAPVERWEEVRDEIRHAADTEGYDDDRGVFRRAVGSTDLDAALLLLPVVGFVDYGDERMVRTADAVAEDLDHDGLLLRYRTDDGLDGQEGAFVACTFWLAQNLAHQGRRDEARAAFDRAMGASNDLGLFSEEVDPVTGRLLGNFPQGLTHLSHVTAALALERAGA